MKTPARSARVTIHGSQFPAKVRRDLLASLRTRRVNHKFHYDSVKQTQKWLALHQAYSPTRNDADCRAIYEQSFAAAAARVRAQRIHVIGLGCGGGQKDTRLLKLLKARGKAVFYTPCDVSTAMVLTARRTALAVVAPENCHPFVCDLATANDLQPYLATQHPSLITFFGMIPNFEPDEILPQLASLVGPTDLLLFSANLAPGKDYVQGIKSILGQYDNAPTRDWLMTFLTDLGVGRGDGELNFGIENGRCGLKRIVARFHFRRARRVGIDGQQFHFKAGDSIQVFYSYRHTPERIHKMLAAHGLVVREQRVAASEEEGVFLCARK